ncbi:Glyco_trans_2-like domain-containing protein [Pseudozyma hubeiensis]|nr:Glyco_trans_2-like domain-containing protein [Pseudozyma hubeiensis]
MQSSDSSPSVSSLPSLPTFNHNLTPASSVAHHGGYHYYQDQDDDMEVMESDDEDRISPPSETSSSINHSYSHSSARGHHQSPKRRTDSYILTTAPSAGSPGSFTYHSTADDSAEASASTDAIHASLVLARHIFSVAVTEKWCRQDNFTNAVAVRVQVGSYILYPQEGSSMPAFSRAMLELNCDAAIIINTPLVAAALSTLNADENEIRLSSSKRVQVVHSLDYLGGARRAQMAAFSDTEQVLVVWTESCRDLIQQVRDFERLLVDYVWSITSDPTASARHSMISRSPSLMSLNTTVDNTVVTSSNSKESDLSQLENYVPEVRSVESFVGAVRGLGVCIATVVVANWIRIIVQTVRLDGEPIYLLALLAIFPMFLVLLPLADNVASCVAMALGPIRPMMRNSRYYSGVTPQAPLGKTILPHVTIQVPVYKESLKHVLQPTLDSVRAAITEYELQGGTASILIGEDGMAVIDEEEKQARLDFYRRHDIAWIARPRHGDMFVRAGRFKKASNLNFSMQIAKKYEESILANPNQDRHSLLQRVLKERHPQAEGEGDVSIGELILLIDSDTRIPADSLLPSAWEMASSPEVGILQHCSGVLIVGTGFFEKSLAYFMRFVYFFISWQTATGEVAPFVGHNAFIRKSAIHELAEESLSASTSDGFIQPWSEETVSEDLDLGLRLLLNGWIVRWATYSNYGFQEGVSLTYMDELNRWRKYTYGIFELFLNPLWRWPVHGPVPKLIRTVFWSSKVPTHYKFNLLAYAAGYLAIGVSLPSAVALYFVQGWLQPWLLPFFVSTFQYWIVSLVIFGASGFIGVTVARHRSGDANIFVALGQHLLWYPINLLTIVSLSFALIKASLIYLISLPISFGVTAKDDSDFHFATEAPLVLREFWQSNVLCLAIVATVSVLATSAVPLGWQITEWTTLVPILFITVTTLLSPFLLNPALIRFSF